jgi:uncharacterized protein (DUF488 family)
VTVPARASTSRPVVYTVGHSTRSVVEFLALLESARIETVVDVRSIPKSRRNPDYNLDRLPRLLADHGVGHEHVAELGGRRGKSRSVAPDVNALWENQSFHNYADHAMSEAFDVGLTHLMELAERRRTAIMCSEAVWWRCHRRIIADHLLARGYEVVHLMSPSQHAPAIITRGAVVEGERVTYPRSESKPAFTFAK